MTLEDRLSTHLKDTSARLSGRPGTASRVAAAAGARHLLARVVGGGVLLAAGLVVVGVMTAVPRGGDPDQSTRVVVSPYVESDGRLQEAIDEVVFVVTTDTPSYWRLASLDVYEDGIWKVSGNFSPGAPGLDETATRQGDRQTVHQDIEIVNLDAIWLPAAPEPVQVAADGGIDVTVNEATNAMTVPNDRPDSDGLRYSVVSLAAVPTPDQLRVAPRTDDPEIVYSNRTSEDGVPAAIRTLAEELTAGSPTDYDRVIAILDHLRSLTVADGSEAVPDGQDPAVRLLQTGQGSSNDFASTMALLARALGIPSRVAIGFTPGERIDDPGRDTGSGLTTFEVTSHDAHAWTEIYFGGIGWVGFEPTPGQTMPLAERYAGTAEN